MNKLQELRQSTGLTMKEVSQQLKIPYTTYVNYEKGTREPNSEMLIALSKFYNTTIDFLLGNTSDLPAAIPPGFQPMPDMVELPRVGRIACGDPITAEENIEGTDRVPADWRADFTLLCEGESMLPSIHDGDVVAIHKQPDVEDGQIAAVRIENDATLKHVYHYPDRLVLQPENTSYAPIVLIGEEINTVAIEGRAVGLCRNL